ncbi:MAG: ABC transporter permease subunit/CPBP intramembrane protease, partial [Myxococcota bacterium]
NGRQPNGRQPGAAEVTIDASPGAAAAIDGARTATLRLIFDDASDTAEMAVGRVREALEAEAARVRARRLRDRGIDAALIEPLRVEEHPTATPAARAGHLLGRTLPILVVFMILMGSFNPALDLTAGEKERGTLETLLCAPVARRDLVVGKFLAVATVALLVALCNLVSLGLVLAWIGQEPALASRLPLAIPWTRLAAALPVVVVATAFFSAVMMAVACTARSYKDAQHLMGPAYLAVAVPALVAREAGGTLTWATALVPGMSVGLLLEGLLAGTAGVGVALLACAATLGWAALALAFATRLYGGESMLFSTDGARCADRPARAAATPGEALATLAMVVALLVYVGRALQSAAFVPGMIATEWLLVLGPCLALAWTARLDRRALGIVRAAPPAFAGALLCGVSAWVLAAALVQVVQERVMPTPPEMIEAMRALVFPDPPRPLPVDLFVLAVGPALCEEVLFRGLVLRATLPMLGPTLAVLANALLFGAFHLSSYHFFGPALMGLLLATIAVRTRSVLPGMLLHVAHNAVTLAVGRALGPSVALTGAVPPWPLALAAALATAAGVWLAGRHDREVG